MASDASSSRDMTALLTPPTSSEGTPEEEETRIHVSTMFYPGAPLGMDEHSSPDVVLLSADSVFFYVHSQALLRSSTNQFGGLLSPNRSALSPVSDNGSSAPETNIVPLDNVSSEILNVLLHTVYNLDCSHYAPSYDVLCATVKTMQVYGYSPFSFIQRKTPLYMLLLSYATSRPLDVYAFAASYNLEDLAVSASSHLLSFSLPMLTDDMCISMGPLYLKRLFFLHLGRVDALKRLLVSPPSPHPPTPSCDFAEQKKLTRAWALASSYLLCDARPDTSVGMLEGALSPLGDHLWCEQCRDMLRERVRALSVSWSIVKTTI